MRKFGLSWHSPSSANFVCGRQQDTCHAYSGMRTICFRYPVAQPFVSSTRPLKRLRPSLHPVSHDLLARAVQDDDDAPIQLEGDWRAFRAGLVAQSDGNAWNGGTVCDQNMELLRQQDTDLAEEPVWAHPTEHTEPGTVLLASAKAPGLLKDPRMWQLVILVLEHGGSGSRGVILNRPALPVLGDLLSAVNLQGDLAVLARAFSGNTIYLGGMYSPNKMSSQKLTAVHPHKQLLQTDNGQLQPSKELVPGIYVGGEIGGAQLVEEGKLSAGSFRFFAGLLEWGPGQLAMEINSGIWHPAACSRNLVVKQCLQLPVPLWREIMELLGGEYAQAAQQSSGNA